VELPAAALLAGVRQAAVLREAAHARLLLRLEPGRLVLESRQQGAGRITVEQAVGYAGEPLAVAFHPGYLLDLLAALEDEAAVRLELGGPDGPALFVAGDGYRHVLMPLQPAAPPLPVLTAGRGSHVPNEVVTQGR
jgi:DNA polymerase-3 subunit beta